MPGEHKHETAINAVQIKWDLRMRFLVTFVWVICVGIMADINVIMLTGIIAVVTLLILGIGLKRLIKRVSVIAPFMLIVFLTLLISDGFPITEEALEFSLLILCRLLVSVIIITMVSVDEINCYLDSFSSMKLPDALTSTLFLTQRYVHLIHRELKNLQNALNSRLFKAKFGIRSMKIYGQITGGMTIKGIDRSKHIQQAMMSRGFDGRVRTGKAPKISKADIVKSLAAIAVIVALTVIERRFLI